MYSMFFITMRRLLLIMFLPVAVFAQKSNIYEINGSIKGLEEGEIVVTGVYDDYKQIFSRKDSAYVKNGDFHLHGMIEEGPRYYMMNFSKHPDKFCRLLIGTGDNIIIKCDSSILKINHGVLDDYLTITGSSTNETWYKSMETIEFYRMHMSALNSYLQKIKDSVGFDPILVESILTSKKILNQSFVNITRYHWNDFYPSLTISFQIVIHNLFTTSEHSSLFFDLYNQLGQDAKDSYYGKRFKETCRLSVGQLFPNFVLPNIEGAKLDLKGIVNKSKITLVHFWANKSVYREELDQDLRIQYKKYHDKGLNIVGVSADSYLDEWKEALDNEKYPWYNLIDQKGKLTNEVYHEGGHRIPNTTNVLLDDQGKIIAWDPSNIELQYYLWKAFGG